MNTIRALMIPISGSHVLAARSRNTTLRGSAIRNMQRAYGNGTTRRYLQRLRDQSQESQRANRRKVRDWMRTIT